MADKILERIKMFGDKLYLEFGGKLFDDYHSSRVLPGFEPDSKLKMLLQLKDQAEILIAINASDIVLMNDDVESVLKAIKISRKTKSVVIQNIVFSLLVKVIVMALAIFVGVPMYVAIIADVGVAMLAVLNALRIMYTKI